MLARTPLARIRQKAGFTSAWAAAEKLGVSRMHVANVERGRVGASDALRAKMAELYGVDVMVVAEAISRGKHTLLRRLMETSKAGRQGAA